MMIGSRILQKVRGCCQLSEKFYLSIACPFSDHKKLFWEYCNEENLLMAKYMLSLPEICDPEMPDGTTGFSMALARGNAKLVEILLSYYQKYPERREEERMRDIQIAEDAIQELDKNSPMTCVLKKELNNLKSARKAPSPMKSRCKK